MGRLGPFNTGGGGEGGSQQLIGGIWIGRDRLESPNTG